MNQSFNYYVHYNVVFRKAASATAESAPGARIIIIITILKSGKLDDAHHC